MASRSNHNAPYEGILENAWAKVISNGEVDDRAENAPETSKSWEELPNLDVLQRLPSLGRWISMGTEALEEILEYILTPASNKEVSSRNNLGTESTSGFNKKVGDDVRAGKVAAKHYRGVRRRPWGKYAAEIREFGLGHLTQLMRPLWLTKADLNFSLETVAKAIGSDQKGNHASTIASS